jgi:predicted AAA+ superfamily ATPase
LKCSASNPIFYWGRDKAAAEIDFIMQYKNEAVPIEVKSGKNTQAKSLNVYMNEYKPKLSIRTSLKSRYIWPQFNVLREIPLYMISDFEKFSTLP